MDPVPDTVLDALERIRLTGRYNMHLRPAIINSCRIPDEESAAMWLIDNPDRYMEALEALGTRNMQRHGG